MARGRQPILLNEYLLVYFFCMAVMLGPVIAVLFQYDLSQYTDCHTYLGLAGLDLDQSPVRRYRVLIPFAARGIHVLTGGVFNKLAPGYFHGDFSLPFSFFLVNTALMCATGVVIYRYCKAHGIGSMAAVVGLLAFLTSRYTAYIAGLPLTDSLYCLCVAMALFGIYAKDARYIIAAIFIGPFAKESFIFIAPVIFFFSHLPKPKLFLYFLLSGLLVFGFRYLYDVYAGFPPQSGLMADGGHLKHVGENMRTLFSFYGLYKIASNMGLWLFVPFIARATGGRYAKPDNYVLWFLVAVLVQLILTWSAERIIFQVMPVLCLYVGLSFVQISVAYTRLK